MIISIKKIEKNKRKLIKELRSLYSFDAKEFNVNLTQEKKLIGTHYQKEIKIQITYKRVVDIPTKSNVFSLTIYRQHIEKGMNKQKLFIENCKEESDFDIDLNLFNDDISNFKKMIEIDKKENRLRKSGKLLDKIQITELVQMYRRSDLYSSHQHAHSDNIQRIVFGDIKFVDLKFNIEESNGEYYIFAKSNSNGFSIFIRITNVSNLDIVSDIISLKDKKEDKQITEYIEYTTITEFEKECNFIRSDDAVHKIAKHMAKSIAIQDVSCRDNKISLSKSFSLKEIMGKL